MYTGASKTEMDSLIFQKVLERAGDRTEIMEESRQFAQRQELSKCMCWLVSERKAVILK